MNAYDLTLGVGEVGRHVVTVTNGNHGPANLSRIQAMTLTVTTDGRRPDTLQVVPNAELDRSRDTDGEIAFVNAPVLTKKARSLRLSLTNDADGKGIASARIFVD